MEVSYIHSTISCDIGSLTLKFRVSELTLIARAISEHVAAFTFFFAIYPVACINITVGIAISALTVALVVALVMLINHTKIGMAMRAVSVDFETSQLMGIKINNVISVTFIIGSAMAAIGSLLYFTNYTAVTPTVGAMPGLKAFVAAVFGGIGSIPGAMIGALIIGICENLIKAAGWTAFSDAFTFALLIVVLLFRPTGLFGEKTTDKV